MQILCDPDEAIMVLSTSSNLRSRELMTTFESPVQLLGASSHGVVIARVRQSVLGACNQTTGVAGGATADVFAYVYTEPDTMDQVCWFSRDVNACYQRTLAIACDPVTKLAHIDVYIVDATFDPRNEVDNPRVGRCLPVAADPVKRAVVASKTYNCAGTNIEVALPTVASATSTLPSPDSSARTTGELEIEMQADVMTSFCGSNSGVRCNANAGLYCVKSHGATCLIEQDTDLPPVGYCVKMGKTCTTSSDCNMSGGEWCNPYFRKCSPSLSEGECCFGLNENECGLNSVCGLDTTDITKNYLMAPDFRCKKGTCPLGWDCL